MQGSVLGPLLFICFINDLPDATKILKMLIFADDTCALDKDSNLENLITRCNTELQKLANWFSTNKISVNVNKCKFILFHRPRKKFDEEICKIFYNANEIGAPNNPKNIFELSRVSLKNPDKENTTYKYLGIHLDEHMNFNSHIQHLCNKLSKSLFCLNRIKNILDKKSLRTIYFSIFHSHLLYCNAILNCTSQTNIKRISILQKKAIRIINLAKYNEHTAPLFYNSKILPFEKLIELNKLLFMHSIHFNYCHSSFLNIWPKNNLRVTDHSLRNQTDFILPFPNTDNFKRFPLYDFPKSWNNLYPELKCQHNRFTFKIALINKIFENIYLEFSGNN